MHLSLVTRPLGVRLSIPVLLVALAAAVTTVFVTVAPSPASAAVAQTSSCVDGGGALFRGKAIWGATYTGSDGVVRVAMDYAGWTTTRSGSVAVDSRVRSYDGTGRLVGDLSWTGLFDYRSGAAYRGRNPANPPSAPGRAKVSVTVGVDGDGRADCTMSFVQPGAVASPSPTATASPPSPTAGSPSPTATTTSPSSTSAPSSPAPTTGSPGDRYQADVVTITNSERTSRALVALTTQACVDKYAEAQAQRMASENRMYHQELGPIMTDCGLNMVGENVAYGYPDGTAVMAGWMGSSGHRANILNSSYRLLGVGASQDSQGRWYAAQVFGRLQ